MTYPNSVGGANALGMVTPDYSGSRQEWETRVLRDLLDNYAWGRGGMPGYGNGSIGQPNPADFGNQTISGQTYSYFERYVKQFGANDPWITQNYGAPPTRNATYVPDPNSPASIQGTYAERAKEAAQERASRERIAAGQNAAQIAAANIQANAQITATRMQTENAWRIAQLDDATRRYIAEGDWGTQKWVTEANNAGAMARLQLELGQRDEELAQRAVEERDRHGEAMTGLALEVAKYDAELAASPRNWLKYAAWLKDRDILVNGITLAMAAQEVPDAMINPAAVAQSTGDNLAAAQTAQEAQTGQPAAPPTDAGGGAAASPAPGTGQAPAPAPQGTTDTPGPRAAAAAPHQETPAEMARRLLGSFQQTSAETTPEALQATVNSLGTTGQGGAFKSNASGGTATNAQGINIPEFQGKDVDYRNFGRLLPVQQQMKAGAVASVRGDAGVSDWVAEMNKSRPKGGNALAATFG
jgi:hypothetical protein